MKRQPTLAGPLEPPNDYRIFNRRRADGTFPPLSEFFEQAVRKADEAVEHSVQSDGADAPPEVKRGRRIIKCFVVVS